MLIFATFLIIFRKFCGLKLVINKDAFLLRCKLGKTIISIRIVYVLQKALTHFALKNSCIRFSVLRNHQKLESPKLTNISFVQNPSMQCVRWQRNAPVILYSPISKLSISTNPNPNPITNDTDRGAPLMQSWLQKV